MFERIIADHARTRRNAAAYVDGASTVTYQQMAEDLARCTGWLRTRGIKPGDRVVLHVANVYLHWVLFFALEAHGAVSASVRTASPLAAFTVALIKADFYFTDQAPAAVLLVHGAILGRGTLSQIRKFRALPPTPRQRSSDDPICIVLSSGTTGTPKKVLLSRSMIDTRAIIERSSALIDGNSRVLVSLPNESIGGLLTILSTWAVGGTVCMRPSSLPTQRALTMLRPTMIAGAPSHFVELLGELSDEFSSDQPIDASTGGGALPDGVAAGIRQKLRGRIATTYGSTEMGYVARGDHDLARQQDGAVGFVLPFTEVSIRDDDGNAVPQGEIGEIWVRGRHVVDGYLEHPDQTTLSFRDGWYHPGDIGAVRADGLLSLHGRTDDLMNFRGRKILPLAIEAKVLGLGMLEDVAIVMACPPGQAEPMVWIVCVASRPFSTDALTAVLPRDFPYIVAYADAIPRNVMGKIERVVLRKYAEEGNLRPQFA